MTGVKYKFAAKVTSFTLYNYEMKITGEYEKKPGVYKLFKIEGKAAAKLIKQLFEIEENTGKRT